MMLIAVQCNLKLQRYDHGLKHGDIIQGPYFPQVKVEFHAGF